MIYAYGENAAFALARARMEHRQNSYLHGDACWRLSDLRGKAKEWRGGYVRTRDNAKDWLVAAATRYGCKVEIIGSNAFVFRQKTLELAKLKVKPFITTQGDQWTCYVRDPSPTLLQRVVKMDPAKAGLILGVGDTIVAAAFAEKPIRLKGDDKVVPTAGNANRYAIAHILDCVSDFYDRAAPKHRDKVRVEDSRAASRKNASMLRRKVNVGRGVLEAAHTAVEAVAA